MLSIFTSVVKTPNEHISIPIALTVANGDYVLNTYSTWYQQSVSCDPGSGWLIINSQPCFPPFLLTCAKNGFQVGERQRPSRMRGSVSLPRSIGESKPMLMFHSSLCLFYVFTFYFKSFFIWNCQKAKKMLTNSVWAIPASLFALDPRKKKKSATSCSTNAPQSQNTLSLPHSGKVLLHGWSNLYCCWPWAEEHSGLGPHCLNFLFFTLVSF